MPRQRDCADTPAAAQRSRADLTFAFTGLLSAAAHAGLIGGVFIWAVQQDPGAVEKPSDAISAELTISAVQDATDTIEEKETSAASAASAASQGEQNTTAPQVSDVVPASQASMSSVKASDLVADVSPATAPSEIVEAKDVSDTTSEKWQTKPKDKASIAKPDEQKPDIKKNAERPTTTAKASQASRPSAGTSAAQGRSSASRGNVLSYAAKVRARVANRKPSGSGVRGTVVVAFSVTPSGSIGYARLAASSGNSSIDRAAVGAVRGAGPFPPPPAGSGTLSFSVPFYYR